HGLLDAVPDRAEAAPDVADVVIAGLDARTVSQCLARLPESQRLCIVLMDVAGYTAREAAAALGCPRGTVLARGHRGRRKLAQLLTEAGVSHGRPCPAAGAVPCRGPRSGRGPGVGSAPAGV